VSSGIPSSTLEEVIGRVLPAVASITAGQARGTGFFIRPDQVLTNAHVVEGQTSVRLQVS
jgi:S1-C subfamily serine protease